MNKLRDKLDPKYLKVCTYAAATVILVVITIMILAYSGGFWHTLWTMFTAMLKPIIIGSVICYLFLPLIKKIENMLSKEEKPWRRTAAVAIFYGVIALILLLLILVLFFALKGGIDSIREMDFKAISDFVVSITHRFSSELKAIEEKLATSTLPIGKVGDIELRQAVLTVAEEVAGASELQVHIGDLKAVIRATHHAQALFGILALIIGNEDTVALVRSPADASAQLVKGGEA